MKNIIYLLLFLTACQNATQNKTVAIAKHEPIYTQELLAYSHSETDHPELHYFNHTAYDYHRYYEPVYPLKIITYANNIPEIQNFVAQHHYHSSYRPLIGIVTESQEDILTVNQFLLQVQRRVSDIDLLKLMTDEILAKVIAYRNLKKGQTVPVPTVFISGESQIVVYKVDKVFDLSGGMPAFGLVPINYKKEVPPILLFRGTDLTLSIKGTSSVLADLDLNGPGVVVFDRAQDDLHAWLQKVSVSCSKARVLGYSLGGSFVQYTCIYEYDLISKDPNFPSVAFNEPGISDDLVLKWNQLALEKKPPLLGYITEGDLVSYVGKLVGSVNELKLDHKLEPLNAHTTLMSAEQRLYAYPIDVTLKHELDYSATTD